MRLSNSLLKIIAALLSAAVLFSCTAATNDDSAVSQNEEDALIVHFFDVGEGDSEFIELPQGKCMLVDAGEKKYGDDIVDRIEALGYSKIDYLVATHPHSDHIGGMSQVVEAFEIGEIYMPKAASTSDTQKNLLTLISEKGMTINTAVSGKSLYTSSYEENQLSIKILAPNSDEYEEFNNYSAVIKLTYGKNSFLFTGDAEAESEREMLARYDSELDSDVLKVGHHGSKTSSGRDFIEAVSPLYAVISCSSDNYYNHPHMQTLKTLSASSAEIYRTDECADIVFECCGDGNYDIIYGDFYEMDN